MMKYRVCAALVLASAPVHAHEPESYIANAKEYVDKADWKNMEVVTVTLEEHRFTPRDIKLKAGKAYKIELRNMGEQEHYYTAPEFNRAVAWRKAMVNKQAEIKAPYFTAFEVASQGGQVDLYLVPVTRGSYPVYCTMPGHREMGMEGTLTVE